MVNLKVYFLIFVCLILNLQRCKNKKYNYKTVIQHITKIIIEDNTFLQRGLF